MTSKQLAKPIKIALADDHQLFRDGLKDLLHKSYLNIEVCFEAIHGKVLIEALENGLTPDLILLDANMPIMDGFKTADAIKTRWPDQKILMLTMLDDEESLHRIVETGIDGYVNKDTDPEELNTAIDEIIRKGSYFSGKLTKYLISTFRKQQKNPEVQLNAREVEFLKLCCSEDTYQMIADKMCLSIKTIDGYRGRLF